MQNWKTNGARQRALKTFLAGHALSTIGSRMQSAALLWHVYTLTGSPLALGAVGAFELVPLLLLSAVGGVVADRHPRRAVLGLTQLFQAIPVAAVAWLTFEETVGLWALYGTTAALATAQAFDVSARKAFLAQLAPGEALQPAMGVADLTKNVAKLAGPAVMGVLVSQVGLGWVYALNAASFVVMALILASLRGADATLDPGHDDAPNEEPAKGLKPAVDLIRAHPVLRGLIQLDFLATLGAGAESLLPMVADQVLGLGAQGYGVLASASAAGALLGGFVLLSTRPQHLGRWVLGSVLAYGIATIGFGLAHSAVTCFIALGLIGFSDTVSTVLRNTLVQLETPDRLRGRVTAIATMFSKSGPRLGQLEAGMVAQAFGLTASIVSGGVFCCAAVVLIGSLNGPLRNLTSPRADAHASTTAPGE